MADTTDLKNRVRSSIKQNDNQEITGLVLQNTLLDIIDELNYNTESEEERAGDAEATLQQSINSETARAQQAEAALAQSISSETTRAQQAEAALQQNIQQSVNAETTRAEQAEAALQQSMEAEKSRLTPILTAMQQNISECVNNGYYDSSTKKIVLRHNTTLIAQIDATEFIKDGMVSNVQIVNGNLVITFNTDAGQEPIIIPLTDIFNPNNYYNKSEIDQKLSLKQNTIQDLAAIRSGASAGSTAYQKPLYGIPKADLSLQIQEILENAAQNYIEHEDVTSAEPITVEPLTNPIYLSGPCDVYPGETFRFMCNIENHNTYVIKDGNTPILLAQSNYGEVRWTNIYDTKVTVFGACESAEHECLVSVFTNGLSKQRLRADVQKAIEKAETAAQPDGYYETLGAGTANNIKANSSTDREIMFDTSGGQNDIASGAASIGVIKGNTAKWNQLLDNYTSTTKNVNSVSFVYDANSKCTVSGTATSSGGRTTRLHANNFSLTKNHKYYITIPFSGIIYFSDATDNAYITERTVQKKAIITFTESKDKVYIGHNTVLSRTYEDEGYFQLIDLTLIYGARNEPTSVEQFEADYKRWFGKPLTYEPYDAGSFRNVMMSAIKTVGFNQWDEEWEVGGLDNYTGATTNQNDRIRSKNFISCFPNTNYFIRFTDNADKTTIYVYFYDSSKNYISYLSGRGNQVIVSPNNACYMKFRTYNDYGTIYNHDICINLSWSGYRNGEYEPYWESIKNFPVTQLTGKLNGQGESVVIFPNGMKKAINAFDEIKVENSITKGLVRNEIVDLGNYNWIKYEDFAYIYPSFGLSNYDNLIIDKYPVYYCPDNQLPNIDTVYFQAYSSILRLRNVGSMTVEEINSLLVGVKMCYALETPREYILDDNILPAMYKVDDFGTEEILPACTDEAPCCAPILSVKYAVNAADQLRRMPQSYISKASLDNLLSLINSTLVSILGGTISVNPTQTNDAYTFAFNEVSNMVVFVSNGSQITNIIGNFPPYSYIDNGKAKFYLRHDSALIPLSVAYTGSITAVGVYSPYGSNDTYTVRFKGAYNTDIIGAAVNVEQIN